MLDLDDHVARLEVRIVQDLAGIETRAAGNARPGEDLHDLVLRALGRPRFHQAVDLALALPAGVGGLVARVADEIGAPYGAQQRVPHLLLDEDEDVVVGAAGMAAIGRSRHAGAELVPRPLHGLSEALVIAKTHPDEVDD